MPEDIASGAANISDALRIGPEDCASRSCKEIKLKDHMQHLHFTLAGGDGNFYSGDTGWCARPFEPCCALSPSC